ncbi:MAG: hypothetical protein J7L15_05675 [Clostridiales bacterium]|nr:hypothetical protein [Clostridiales bacterium]
MSKKDMKKRSRSPKGNRNYGRKNEFWMRMVISILTHTDPSFIALRSKSANGCDIWAIGEETIKKFPFCVEAKAVKRLNIFNAFTQAMYNTYQDRLPLVLAKKDSEGHSKKYADHIATLRMVDFFVMLYLLNQYVPDWYDQFKELREKFNNLLPNFSDAKEGFTFLQVKEYWGGFDEKEKS